MGLPMVTPENMAGTRGWRGNDQLSVSRLLFGPHSRAYKTRKFNRRKASSMSNRAKARKDYYDAYIAGRRIYTDLQIVGRTDDGSSILGWSSGSILDPLDVKRGKWHIVNAWEDPPR